MSTEIKKLIDGNKEFKKKYLGAKNNLFNDLVQFGQKPKILVVSCSDSRVDPAIVFNCQPGELFVIRNMANLIPQKEENNSNHGTSAALEFGVCFLEVEHIIIFGHTQCGGIQALLQNSDKIFCKKNQSFIAKWLEIARAAYNKVFEEHKDSSFEEKTTLCEQYALINSLNNLYTFEWIKSGIENKKLSVHAWYFDLATGSINMYDREKNNWVKE